jgi:hypothetical protein
MGERANHSLSDVYRVHDGDREDLAVVNSESDAQISAQALAKEARPKRE